MWRIKVCKHRFYQLGIYTFVVIIMGLSVFIAAPQASASHFSPLVRGKILLDVEQNGEAWYMYPSTMRRYYLGRPADAFDIMRELSLGITDSDLSLIPIAGSGEGGAIELRQRLSGMILLQTEQQGEAWYVYPDTLERYFLGRPSDAFALMTELGLGISSANLAHLPIASSSLEPPLEEASSYRFLNLSTSAGSFPVRLVTLRRDKFEMVTDTAETTDCDRDCGAQPLDAYVKKHNGFAAIHGTYFCPPEYPACADQENTFLPPVFKTATDTMINETGLRFFNRPMIAQATTGELFYFHRAPEFGDSVADFEADTGLRLQAAIGNWPSLVEADKVVVEGEPLEPDFTMKSTRGGIGWNDEVVYLVLAGNATVPDVATIFSTLGADYAINLDGGGSAALYYDGTYRVGPGRDLPNAIIFRRR